MNKNSKLIITILIIVCWTILIIPFSLFDFNDTNGSGIVLIVYYYQFILGAALFVYLIILILLWKHRKSFYENNANRTRKFYLISAIYPVLIFSLGILLFQYRLTEYQKEWKKSANEKLIKEENILLKSK